MSIGVSAISGMTMVRLRAITGSQWRRTDRIAGRSASWHGVQSSSLLPHARTAADPHQCFSVVRRRNFIAKTAMPFRREFSALGTEIIYDTGDYAGLLDKFLNRVQWETLHADVVQRRQAGEMVGLGLGFFVEKSGLGPFDDVRITLGGDGTIEVITGAASISVPGAISSRANTPRPRPGLARISIRWFRDRQDAAARRRIVQNFQTYTVFTGSRVWSATLAAGATDAFGATGGGTCAGGAAASASSSSSFIPALNALMPFAKSPITRGSFPAPNRMRIMAKTTIQCIKLKEPIATTSERWRKTIITSFSAQLPAHSGAAARCYEVVPMSGKSTPVSEIERR